ncbi:uncharacterized protein CDAR_207101 [Caerostris darwini]|uniref:Uncharacterized protein n=1 Tax=Caerostris darwini TaxID=1538125 RepID=A0AAV4SU91_9ARAC|nr:uncharacterized protein CDAR_207101 [Caerostris darwini]
MRSVCEGYHFEESFPEWNGSTYMSVHSCFLPGRREAKWTEERAFPDSGCMHYPEKEKPGQPLYPSGKPPQGRAVNGPDWKGSPVLVFWENKHKLPQFGRTLVLVSRQHGAR